MSKNKDENEGEWKVWCAIGQWERSYIKRSWVNRLMALTSSFLIVFSMYIYIQLYVLRGKILKRDSEYYTAMMKKFSRVALIWS